MPAINDRLRSDTLLRQWAMLKLIPRQPRRISTTEIWNRLRDQEYMVDVRTVQRDLDKLSTVFPLICDEHKPKGWSWMKDAEPFNLPTMDAHTALSYRILRIHSEHLLPRSTLRHLEPFFTKAENILAVQSGSDLERWSRKVAVISSMPFMLPPEVAPEVIDAVYDGLLQERCLKIQYQSLQAQESREALVHPLGLVFRSSVIYLICTFWHYSDLRHLALHRIHSAQLLDEPFVTPPGFELRQRIHAGDFQYPEGGEIELVLRMDDSFTRYIKETPLSNDQQVVPGMNGWNQLSATVQRTQQLRWWLLSFGQHVEVIAPLEFREEMEKIVQGMNRMYASSISDKN